MTTHTVNEATRTRGATQKLRARRTSATRTPPLPMPGLLLDATERPDIVTVPARSVLAYEGVGAPEGDAFQAAFGAEVRAQAGGARQRLSEAAHHQLLGRLLCWRRCCGTRRLCEAAARAVTQVQYFGSALQLSPRFQALVADGVFVVREGVVGFVEVSPPTPKEVAGP